MATNLVRFCTAALAGSIIGISYERWSTSHNQPRTYNDLAGVQVKWPSLGLTTVSASTSLGPPTALPPFQNKPGGQDTYELDPVASAENLKHSSRFGLPSKDNIRLFNDFIISYDRRLRAPVWVMEHITASKLAYNEEISRKKSNFKEDVTLHEYFRAKLADFAKSGFDRGHMAAAGNHKTDQRALDQTFILSNISPQEPKFNQGGWERLETYVRWRAKRSKNLYCVTGPLYLPMVAHNGKTYVTYQVIGGNQVSVPTHYYKVFLYETNDDKLTIEAFLMPNDNKLDDNINLDDWRIPLNRLDTIERASGVIFFDLLDRNKLYSPASLPSDFKQGPRQSIPPSRVPDQIAAKS